MSDPNDREMMDAPMWRLEESQLQDAPGIVADVMKNAAQEKRETRKENESWKHFFQAGYGGCSFEPDEFGNMRLHQWRNDGSSKGKKVLPVQDMGFLKPVEKDDPRLLWYSTHSDPRGLYKGLTQIKNNIPVGTECFLIAGTFSEQPRDPTKSFTHTLPVLPKVPHSGVFDRTVIEEYAAQKKVACGNCKKFGHTLQHCVWPYDKKNGDIPGCPRCNTMDHEFDHCHASVGQMLTINEIFKTLVLDRAGKCPIRSNWPWIEAVLALIDPDNPFNPSEGSGRMTARQILPWTRDYAVHIITKPGIIEALEKWDYAPVDKAVHQDEFTKWPKIVEYKEANDGRDGSFTRWRTEVINKGIEASNRRLLEAGEVPKVEFGALVQRSRVFGGPAPPPGPPAL
ncbi:hypothetical protein F4780DRAFT_740500 [Xylariomycetidae sp. FL0641]|nr:hypothetical protein F4780DRAFT_740500 [Xylariomycetidae sp. FL0641]